MHLLKLNRGYTTVTEQEKKQNKTLNHVVIGLAVGQTCCEFCYIIIGNQKHGGILIESEES